MFCNKGRIKISSFFLFFLAEDGENRLLVADGTLAGDVVGCPLSLPENVGTFFYFLYKIKKTLYKKYLELGRLSETVRCVCGKC